MEQEVASIRAKLAESEFQKLKKKWGWDPELSRLLKEHRARKEALKKRSDRDKLILTLTPEGELIEPELGLSCDFKDDAGRFELLKILTEKGRSMSSDDLISPITKYVTKGDLRFAINRINSHAKNLILFPGKRLIDNDGSGYRINPAYMIRLLQR